MAEKIGSIYYDLDLDDKKFKSGMAGASDQTKSFSGHLKESSLQLAALGAAATLALQRVVAGLQSAIDATVKQQNALMGLNSIAKAFGQDAGAAEAAAKKLAADGLMPIGDAAAGLKNLLAAGFELPQAIELMNRFKDSAAFGRQGALNFGQAIVGATEGIKNGNSILVDNAGVTKNLSMILEEAGFSAQDLMKASTDAGVRQAIFNGILKETNPMLGDAAKLSDSFGGSMERNKTAVTNMKVAIGTALQPILTKLLEIVAPLIEKFTNFAKEHPQIVAAILGIAVAGLALVAFLGILGGIVGALMNLAPLFAAIGGVIAGITAPALLIIGAIILAVIAIVMAMKTHWDTIVNLFNQYLKPALDQIWQSIKALWASLVELWNVIAPVIIPILKVLGVILLVVLGVAIGLIVAAIWVFVNVLNVVVNALTWFYKTVFSALSSAWNSVKGFWDGIVNAFNSIKNWIQQVIDAFGRIVGGIGNALSGVGEAIMKPFRAAFDWIKEKAEWAKNQLNKINPFHRESPSLVDWITRGTDRIKGLYGQMYGALDTMAMQNRGVMVGTSSSLAAATGGASGEGSIATPPVVVAPNFSGVVARSRSEWRDIVADGISAVNEELRARGIEEIGGGKVEGSTSNG